MVVTGSSDSLWVSHDGGRTGRKLTLRTLAQVGISAAGFANGRDGLVLGGSQCGSAEVFATKDGGGSWRAVGEAGVLPISFAFDGPVAVAAGCPGNEVSISYDGGRRWYDITVGSELSTSVVTVSAAGRSVAVLCDEVPSGHEYVLFSPDGGRSWAKLVFTGPGASSSPFVGAVGAVVLTGPQSLWAYGPTGLLWHSTDGGRSWSASRPLLPLVS